MKTKNLVTCALLALLCLGCKHSQTNAGIAADADTIEVEVDKEPKLEDLGLRFNEEMPNAKEIHYLADRMMCALWSKDSTETYGDFYWRWAEMLTSVIDSMALYDGMFSKEGSSRYRYRQAMDAVKEYVEPGSAGSQYEMNVTSYVMATADMFLMQSRQIELARAFPTAAIREECVRYNVYMAAEEDGEYRAYDAGFHYSDRPREDNVIAQIRVEERSNCIDDIIQGKCIRAIGRRPSDAAIRKFFHDLLPSGFYPALSEGAPEPSFYTDTIGIHFLSWIACRDSIATQLPKNIGRSYYNQTTNYIIKRIERGENRLNKGVGAYL